MTKQRFLPTGVIALVFCLLVPLVQAQQNSSAPLLTFDELVELYENENPAPGLATKLNRLLTTPFVSNAVGTRPVKAIRTTSGTSGPYVRVCTWNIERGLEFDAVRAALTNNKQFFRRLPVSARNSKFDLNGSLAQALELSRADVIVLNEVDWGLMRTDYRNVARELAAALHMNYAFGVEFVEVDPLNLGTETLDGETSSDKAEMVKHLAVDKSRTVALHGTAILSRFPLRDVKLIPYKTIGHDWYLDKEDFEDLEL